MPLHIKDEETTQLVNRLAAQKGSTKQEAVKAAVKAELDRMAAEMPVMERLKKFWTEHPMPLPTGEVADKAFFDQLSGDL